MVIMRAPLSPEWKRAGKDAEGYSANGLRASLIGKDSRHSGLLIRRGSLRNSKCHGINSSRGPKTTVPRLCLIFRG